MSQSKNFSGKIKGQSAKGHSFGSGARGKASEKKSYKRPERKEPKPPKKITATYLHNSGLYYLERFAASSAHFKTVMMRKVRKSCMHHTEQSYEDCEILVDELVARFIKTELLNDDVYVSGNVKSMRRRGLSERKIIAKLQSKGVKAETTRDALAEFYERHNINPQHSEFMSALKYARKKRLGTFYDPALKGDMTPELKDKHMARLARQGFAYDVCRKLFEIDQDDAQQMLYDERL